MTAMIVDPPTDRGEYVSFSTVLANTGLTRRAVRFNTFRNTTSRSSRRGRKTGKARVSRSGR